MTFMIISLIFFYCFNKFWKVDRHFDEYYFKSLRCRQSLDIFKSYYFTFISIHWHRIDFKPQNHNKNIGIWFGYAKWNLYNFINLLGMNLLSRLLIVFVICHFLSVKSGKDKIYVQTTEKKQLTESKIKILCIDSDDYAIVFFTSCK